jgi:hypothetical protein
MVFIVQTGSLNLTKSSFWLMEVEKDHLFNNNSQSTDTHQALLQVQEVHQ